MNGTNLRARASVNGKNLKYAKMIRVRPELSPLGQMNPGIRCVPVLWVNPYLMFLIFILLLLSFSPPYQVFAYELVEEN